MACMLRCVTRQHPHARKVRSEEHLLMQQPLQDCAIAKEVLA